MNNLDDIVVFAKKNGFIFISSEIYGGEAGVYDYGPLGVELLNNLKKSWWQEMVRSRLDIVGLDSGIFTNAEVWNASGHTESFADPIVEDKQTKKVYRADHLLESAGVSADEKMSEEEFLNIWEKNKEKIKSVDYKNLGTPTKKNLLVSSSLGGEEKYLRGETCQGIYINFKQVLDSMHLSLPFGIAQIGKAFRNEISPRQFLFRTREFEQMEMQYFHYKEDSKKYFDEFKNIRLNHLINLGIKKENLRFKKHERLVFYANAAEDIEYNYPFGWKELEGIHDRGDYDLGEHTKHSNEKLSFFSQDKNEHIIPSVVETSIGLGRLFLAILNEALEEETLKDGTSRVVLKLKKNLAPFSVIILPLLRKDEFKKIAKDMFKDLSTEFATGYDEAGTIGKRYRRADEIGTPFAITIDHQTIEDNSVTIRDRDSMKQDRIKISDVEDYLKKNL